MPKFVKFVSMTCGSRMTFFPQNIQHGLVFVDKMTKYTTVQTDHKLDTQFRKYGYLKLINQTSHTFIATIFIQPKVAM